MALTLRFHNTPISLFRMDARAPVPTDALLQPLASFFRTNDEATLICPTVVMPKGVTSEEPGWIAIEFIGPFAFELTGILLAVAKPLAEAGVAICALTSFSTDYVLIKADKRDAAILALRQAGHSVQS